GYGEDIQLSVYIEISGRSFYNAMHGKEIGLAKVVFAVILKNSYTMVIFKHWRIIAIVAVGIKDINKAIFVHIHQFEIYGSIRRLKPQDGFLPKGSLSVSIKNGYFLVPLCKQGDDVFVAVLVHIPHLHPNGTRAIGKNGSF